MKRFFLACWVVLLCVFYLGGSAWAEDKKAPKMVIKDQKVDLKVIKEGDPIEYTFHVFNEGDQRLQIKKVKPG